ncbi:MAG: TlpA family protein disulfide reductase [Oscillospiraceae bacterium]|nr:TlpA family protein disulfide reductase [Oscillospiraceae bacterium]
MKNKIVIIILSVLLVVSLLFNAVFVYRVYREYRGDITREYMLEAEDMAPDFTVQLLTGETFTLSEHRGTVIVLDFWATWCGPCVAKMPTMQALSERFEGRVTFVGINIGEDPQRVQDFVTERGLTYPIGLDRNSTIHRSLYPSPGIPYMVIINGDGIITDTFSGFGEGMETLYENAILEALG